MKVSVSPKWLGHPVVVRVQLIHQIWVKFYGNSILIMIYQIRKEFARISGSRYRKKVPSVRNFQGKMMK